MEIIVEGLGETNVIPNEVILNLTFVAKNTSYENTLENGILNVKNFVDNILIPNGFNTTDMKTRSFVVREEKKYNEQTRTYIFNGFMFNQNATLTFDYDKERLAKLLVLISKLENAPLCNVNFGIKEINDCKKSVLALAYNDAKLKAEAIASAAGLTLIKCAKVDFKPFTTNYISQSSFERDGAIFKSANIGSVENIVNTFTPEDVHVSEKLYCLWIAE